MSLTLRNQYKDVKTSDLWIGDSEFLHVRQHQFSLSGHLLQLKGLSRGIQHKYEHINNRVYPNHRFSSSVALNLQNHAIAGVDAYPYNIYILDMILQMCMYIYICDPWYIFIYVYYKISLDH